MGIKEYDYLKTLFEEKFNRLDEKIDRLSEEMTEVKSSLQHMNIESARRELTCPFRNTIGELKRDKETAEYNRKKMYKNVTVIISIATILVNVLFKLLKL